jgi:hypothetical protein
MMTTTTTTTTNNNNIIIIIIIIITTFDRLHFRALNRQRLPFLREEKKTK